MKKKLLALTLSVIMAASLSGCASTASSASGTSSDASAKDTSSVKSDTSAATADGSYTIGISQFADHSSLDDCRTGFLQGLSDEGIVEGKNLTVDVQNANADTGTAATIADNFVSKKVNMICAIATPAAMAAYNSTKNADIPVLFTAVSDPVAAELAKEDGTPVGEITGTSDALPVEAQLKMIREILPDAKKIGIMYTTSETNSVSTIATYKELASKYDFEIVESGISTIADVPLASSDLAGKVDCISNLTDNTVVSALQTLLEAANKANIPVFGSEIDQVKQGCLASEGIDYTQLGIQTGKMAAKILKGEAKASETKFETISESSLCVNTKVAGNLGITLPDGYTDTAKAQVFDTVETAS